MRRVGLVVLSLALGACVTAAAQQAPVRLITLDPGHFHAALIQKEMYPGVDPTVNVYAPVGSDLLLHLGRVTAFNLRAEQPTHWRLEVHASEDFYERMLRERPGNVVVLSGRNRGKIDRILGSVEAGLNVLADKPWLVGASDLPKLERVLTLAAQRRLVAYDVMTERSEITTILQGELARDPELTGTIGPGTLEQPAVELASVHHILKLVAGAPNLRPEWFFDTREQGEALADVGTHLVDLVPFLLFPGQALDYKADVQVLAARRWPTVLTEAELRRVTGLAQLGPELTAALHDGRLDYYANGEASFTLKGVHAKVRALWNYEPPEGAGDTHAAVVRGSRARVEIRQGPDERWRPELYVVANRAQDAAAVRAAAEKRVAALAVARPGLAVVDAGGGALRIEIPDRYRVGHEAHFAQVTERFLGYLRDPGTLPAWEAANMLVKYRITTEAAELSRR